MEVHDLRRGPWPREHAGQAPEITKIMYINLDWDTNRSKYMEAQLRNLSRLWEGRPLTWERLPAVDKDSFRDDVQYAEWRRRGFSQAQDPDVQGDWATAACAYSHYSAVSKIPEASGSDLVLITEDDVEISPRFRQLWQQVWPFIPEEWDVLRVGWFGDFLNCTQVVNTHVDRAGWQNPGTHECAYCGAQAYIVNPSAKERVLQRFELSRITHADELLGAPTPQLEDPDAIPPLKSYVVWPMLASTHFDSRGSVAFRSDRTEG